MVKFSIDGARPETYKALRGVSLEKVKNNIKYFRKLTNIPFGIEMVVSSRNIGELDEVPDMAREFGAGEIELRLLGWVVDEFDVMQANNDEIREKVAVVRENCGSDIQLKHTPPEEAHKEGCLVGEWINVDCNGNATVCYYRDTALMGNLLEKPLAQIWAEAGMNERKAELVARRFEAECCCPRAIYK